MSCSARSCGGLLTVAEDPLAQAQRHILEGEQRVAAQTDLIARMKTDGNSEQTIASGEAVLVILRRNLELAREYLAREQAQHQRQE